MTTSRSLGDSRAAALNRRACCRPTVDMAERCVSGVTLITSARRSLGWESRVMWPPRSSRSSSLVVEAVEMPRWAAIALGVTTSLRWALAMRKCSVRMSVRLSRMYALDASTSRSSARRSRASAAIKALICATSALVSEDRSTSALSGSLVSTSKRLNRWVLGS